MRVILVTGASSGIGRTAVIHLARAFPDASFVLVARRTEQLRQTAQLAELRDGSVDLVSLDLADTDAPRRLADHVRVKHGRLDILVNNAGIASETAFDEPGAPASIDRQLDVNLRAPIMLVHELAPLLVAQRGVIINIASVAGLIGQPNSPVYAATKWALTGFSDSIRARYARHGVYVSNVHPGPVPTPGWPHAHLTERAITRPLWCDVDVIGRAIVLAAMRRSAAPVRPRLFHVVPLVRVIAPRFTRWLLARSAHRMTPET